MSAICEDLEGGCLARPYKHALNSASLPKPQKYTLRPVTLQLLLPDWKDV